MKLNHYFRKLVLALVVHLPLCAYGQQSDIWKYTIEKDTLARKNLDYSSITIIYSGKATMDSLPTEIRLCKNVVEVDLLGSKGLNLEKVFEQLSYLPKLEYLMLNSCGIEEIPKGLGKLKNLKRLELTDNPFCHLPRDVSKLKKLEKLDLSYCKKLNFEYALTLLRFCKNLVELDVENSEIIAIPKNIKNLCKLEVIDVSRNKLQTIPCEVALLPHIKTVYISENPFKYIPNCHKKKKYFIPYFADWIFKDK